MILNISSEHLCRLRAYAQHLHPDSVYTGGDVAQLTREIGGWQAQEMPAAHLSIRVRSSGLLENQVQSTREQARGIVLTWALRGTMHLIPAEDVRWMLALLGQIFIKERERRYQQLGLTPEIRQKALKLLPEILHENPLHRAQLAVALAQYDIPVAGQTIAHIVSYAALESLICFGTEHDGDMTYVLVEEWLQSIESRMFSKEAGLLELARRYLTAYAPATAQDFAAWSGLPMMQAKAAFLALADDLLEIKYQNQSLWMLKQHEARLENAADKDFVRLLPRYDTYLLGYQQRDFMLEAAYAKRINAGGGIIHPAVLINGRIVGVWRTDRKKAVTTIIIEPFEPLPEKWLPLLEVEVAEIGRFLQQKTALQLL